MLYNHTEVTKTISFTACYIDNHENNDTSFISRSSQFILLTYLLDRKEKQYCIDMLEGCVCVTADIQLENWRCQAEASQWLEQSCIPCMCEQVHLGILNSNVEGKRSRNVVFNTWLTSIANCFTFCSQTLWLDVKLFFPHLTLCGFETQMLCIGVWENQAGFISWRVISFIFMFIIFKVCMGANGEVMLM